MLSVPGRKKRYIKPVLVGTLLGVLVLAVVACQDFGQFPTPTLPAQKVVTASVITTSDRAVLAVYEHLLSQAQSAKAKAYLAEFYTVCDNWTAASEVFKDGGKVWNVVVDMTGAKTWEAKPYWKQASWFIFEDGKVVPSNRFQANALRIEADLQGLSLPSQS